jgi:endonuclease III
MTTWPNSLLGKVLAKLERTHGKLVPPRLNGPLEMILWEIVAYLADDAQRTLAFEALRTRVGLTPKEILKAPLRTLGEITRLGGSIAPGERAERLQTAARLAIEEFDGDVASVLQLPPQKAKKLLMRFPMIGEPGAEKILLSCGVLDVLALESNGLRTLVRLGFGEDRKSYAATYKAVREVTLQELPVNSKTLMKAHLLLRKHGQEVCLRNGPLCRACAVSSDCRYFGTPGQRS